MDDDKRFLLLQQCKVFFLDCKVGPDAKTNEEKLGIGRGLNTKNISSCLLPPYIHQGERPLIYNNSTRIRPIIFSVGLLMVNTIFSFYFLVR